MPIDYAATVQAALRLQPETRHLVVLCGSASAERFNLDYAMKQITPLIGNLDVIHITGLPLPELEDRLAGLPKQSITDYEEAGYEGGALTLRILNGEQPSSISPQITKSAHFVYDWRQLQKWGIDESRLPAAAGYCTDLHHSGKNTNGESAERSHC